MLGKAPEIKGPSWALESLEPTNLFYTFLLEGDPQPNDLFFR